MLRAAIRAARSTGVSTTNAIGLPTRAFAAKPTPTFDYKPVFESKIHLDIPYRKLTSDYVSTQTINDQEFLKVEPEGIRMLTETAMFEIAHLLRPSHLAQVCAVTN